MSIVKLVKELKMELGNVCVEDLNFAYEAFLTIFRDVYGKVIKQRSVQGKDRQRKKKP